jgi:hypothetical protein
MRKHLIALISLSFAAAACGNAGIPDPTTADDVVPPQHAATTAKVAKKKVAKAEARDATSDQDLSFLDEQPEPETAIEPAEASSASPLVERQVGDFTVHRFSGSFAKKPLILTEEVVARAGSLVVVDYTLEQGKQHEKLRVTHDATTDRVMRVREMHGKKEIPSSLAAYQAMLDKTMFVPDENVAQLGDEKGTCVVAGKAIDCERKSYRVKIGDQTATLSLSENDDGQDIGGEISAADGKIIYKAELLQSRSGTPGNVASR